jgi:hypothetical protein
MRRIARICLSALLAYAVAALVFVPLFFLLWPVFYWGWHYVGRRRAAHGLRTLLWIGETKSVREHDAKQRARFCLSALLAYAVAAPVFAPLFFLFWPVFFWGWHYVGRHRAAHGLRTLLWIEAKKPAAEDIARERSGLRQSVRAIGLAMGLFMCSGLAINSVACELNQRTAKEAHAAVHEGMTVGEVLHSMSPEAVLTTNSDAPWLDRDRYDLIPAVLLGHRNPENQKFRYEGNEISESEALAVLHRRLVDGYPWRFEFLFIGVPIRYSFKVIFDRDGRVQEVTPLFSGGP